VLSLNGEGPPLKFWDATPLQQHLLSRQKNTTMVTKLVHCTVIIYNHTAAECLWLTEHYCHWRIANIHIGKFMVRHCVRKQSFSSTTASKRRRSTEPTSPATPTPAPLTVAGYFHVGVTEQQRSYMVTYSTTSARQPTANVNCHLA